MVERINGQKERTVPKNPLEDFVLDTLALLHPQALVQYEPLVAKTASGKKTIPDISFSYPNTKIEVLVEVTASRRFYKKDPKIRQYRRLRTYEIENHKEKKYHAAVLYGQHFFSPLATIAAFEILNQLAQDKLESPQARKRLNILASRIEVPEVFRLTKQHLSQLEVDIRQLLRIPDTFAD